MLEFANTASGQLTITDFSQSDVHALPAADPPFVIKQRQKKALAAALTIDKDGFVVPPIPQRASQPLSAGDPISVLTTAAAPVEEQLDALASSYGDRDHESESTSDIDTGATSEYAMAEAQGIHIPMSAKRKRTGANGPGAPGAKKTKTKITLPIDDEWERDEAEIEAVVQDILMDPALEGVAEAAAARVQQSVLAAKAKEAARARATAGTAADGSAEPVTGGDLETTPPPEPDSIVQIHNDEYAHLPAHLRTPASKVSNEPIVGEDEFADDPEVMHCRLAEEDVKFKEEIWLNANLDYLRSLQQKIFQSKLAGNNPVKQRRNRTRKPRIGEAGSPAPSAEEAAVNMMRNRGVSTRLDYSKLGQLFDISTSAPGSAYGGGESNTSYAGSVAGDDETGGGMEPSSLASSTAKGQGPAPAAPNAPEEDEEGDEDDYIDPVDDNEPTFAEETFVEDEEEQYDGYDEEDYGGEEYE